MDNQQVLVSAGTYRTATRPAFTVTLDGDWTLYDNDPKLAIQMNEGADFTAGILRNLFAFPYPGTVIGHDNRSLVRAPDPIARLRTDPRFRVLGGPVPVVVGGVRGTELDIEAVDPPPCTYAGDGSRCWNVLPLVPGDPFTAQAKEAGSMLLVGTATAAFGGTAVSVPARVVFVTVFGQTVGFEWNDAVSTFHSSVRDFEQLLHTVSWG